MGSSPFWFFYTARPNQQPNEDDISLSQKKRFRMGRALANGWTTHKHLQGDKIEIGTQRRQDDKGD